MTSKTTGANFLDDPYTWGRLLVKTGDLDPIYIMLWHAGLQNEMKRPQLARWLIAYWCLYHAGAASFISEVEGSAFWRRLRQAAENTEPAPTGGRWPRGHERRHWRGDKAVISAEALERRFPEPEMMIQFLFEVPTYDQVTTRAMILPQFGPWIAFKMADMGERILQVPIRFPEAVIMYKEPAAGAKLMADLCRLTGPKSAVSLLWGSLAKNLAPPILDRACGIQEVETVLCKWKSARSGHYYIGKDIDEIREGLEPWGATANLLSRYLPPAVTNEYLLDLAR